MFSNDVTGCETICDCMALVLMHCPFITLHELCCKFYCKSQVNDAFMCETHLALTTILLTH